MWPRPPLSVSPVKVTLKYQSGVPCTMAGGENRIVPFMKVSTHIVRSGVSYVCLCFDSAHGHAESGASTLGGCYWGFVVACHPVPIHGPCGVTGFVVIHRGIGCDSWLLTDACQYIRSVRCTGCDRHEFRLRCIHIAGLSRREYCIEKSFAGAVTGVILS